MSTFSVLEAITGATYPSDDVVIYTDQKAAYDAHQLDIKMGDVTDLAELDALIDQHAALVAKVKDSALTFHLQGLPSEVRNALSTSVDAEFGIDDNSDEKNKALSYAMLAAHIVHVTNAKGEKDETVWTRESVEKLLSGVHGESFPRFYDAMNALTLQAAYFEGVEVSPDFS